MTRTSDRGSTMNFQGRDDGDYRTIYIDLMRVLHILEQDVSLSSNTAKNNQIPSSWYQARIAYCLSLCQQLEAIQVTRNIPIDLNALHERVENACQRSEQILQTGFISNCNSNVQRDPNEAIHQLFFSSQSAAFGDNQTQPEKDQYERMDKIIPDIHGDGDDDEDEEVKRINDLESDNYPTSSYQVSPEELQAQQREQMEEAIREMAAQMKEETARIHQTLRSQTVGLDELENVTTENVQAVTKVAQDVDEHVRQGWTKTVGTWTMLILLIGMFCFTLVTIFMAPKRRDVPCLFFCSQDERFPMVTEQGHLSDRFCRALSDGTRECLEKESHGHRESREDHRVTPAEKYDAVISDSFGSASSCELDIDGECQDATEQDDKLELDQFLDSAWSAEEKNAHDQFDPRDDEKEQDKIIHHEQDNNGDVVEHDFIEEDESTNYDQSGFEDDDEEEDDDDEEEEQESEGEDAESYEEEKYIAENHYHTEHETEEEPDDFYDDDAWEEKDTPYHQPHGDAEMQIDDEDEEDDDAEEEYETEEELGGFDADKERDIPNHQLHGDVGIQINEDEENLEEADVEEGEPLEAHTYFDSLDHYETETKDQEEQINVDGMEMDMSEHKVNDGSEIVMDQQHDVYSNIEEERNAQVREEQGHFGNPQLEPNEEENEKKRAIDSEDEISNVHELSVSDIRQTGSDEFDGNHHSNSPMDRLEDEFDAKMMLDQFLDQQTDENENENSDYPGAEVRESHEGRASANDGDDEELLDLASNEILEHANEENERHHRSDPGEHGDLSREGQTQQTDMDGFSSESLETPYSQDTSFSLQDVHAAMENGNLESLEGYLSIRPEWGQHGDDNGWTAWHLAARSGNLDVIAILKRTMGGVSESKNIVGQTPHDIAFSYWGTNHPVTRSVSNLIEGEMLDQTAVGDDAFEQSGESYGGANDIQPNADDSGSSESEEVDLPKAESFTLQNLHHAAENGNLESLEGYLSIRPEWGQDGDDNGWTAWHLAARAGNTEAIALLKKFFGGVSESRNLGGETALDVASRHWGSDHPVTTSLSS